ncbi:unnamed protein product, partial [Meganyctiphanes norvegica]
RMKIIRLLGILLLLSGTSLGQESLSYNSYQNPPTGYGPPPHKPHQCHPQKCTDSIIITKSGFQSIIETHTVTYIIPVLTQTLTTTLYTTALTQTKTVCDPVDTILYNIEFETSSSSYVIDECIPTQHTRMVTNYIPRSIPVTVNHCTQSLVYHTVMSIGVKETEVPITTFTFGETTKEMTTYQPTSTMEYWPICTESMKCEHGHGYTQIPYY